MPRSVSRALRGVLGFFVALTMLSGFAAQPPSDADVDVLLLEADTVKSSNPTRFAEILRSLEQRAPELDESHQYHVSYLRGWHHAYTGMYEDAINTLRPLIAAPAEVNLKFRARSTMVNVLLIAQRYEEAFSELSTLVEQLDLVTDQAARDQGLAVAAFLYAEVGQHDLSLVYADRLIEENWNGRGACRGGQLKVQSLYDGSRPRARPATLETEIRQGIDACIQSDEPLFANVIRSFEARLLLESNQPAAALELLSKYYEETLRTRYPRLISQFNVLHARAYLALGDSERARDFALRAVDSAVQNQFTEPLVTAYHLLHSLEKQRGDIRAALEYHEKYTIADKGYLDDISARQLAYERVKNEVAANRLQIESLQLQRELDAKAIENVRLYVALLIVVLAFIAFWAYRTKRSQLHFMNLARRDGLTGIINRPHFMDLASSTLENCRKLQQDVAVILFDLDHFKQINDRFGHAEGDATLKRIVAACQTRMRAADIFARLGGEEFCILLPACNLEDAGERAEELRIAMADLSNAHVAKTSASLGVAGTADSGYDLNQLLAHADHALYQAKHKGRNCVVVYVAETQSANR